MPRLKLDVPFEMKSPSGGITRPWVKYGWDRGPGRRENYPHRSTPSRSMAEYSKIDVCIETLGYVVARIYPKLVSTQSAFGLGTWVMAHMLWIAGFPRYIIPLLGWNMLGEIERPTIFPFMSPKWWFRASRSSSSQGAYCIQKGDSGMAQEIFGQIARPQDRSPYKYTLNLWINRHWRNSKENWLKGEEFCYTSNWCYVYWQGYILAIIKISEEDNFNWLPMCWQLNWRHLNNQASLIFKRRRSVSFIWPTPFFYL